MLPTLILEFCKIEKKNSQNAAKQVIHVQFIFETKYFENSHSSRVSFNIEGMQNRL